MSRLRLPADRRRSLLAAARRVFARKGYEAATVAEIVAEAGVAQGTFYLYFPSKRAAAAQLAEDFHCGLMEAVASAYRPGRPLVESVRPTVEAAFLYCRDNLDLMRLFEVEIALDSEACRKAQASATRQRFHAWLQEVIRRHAEQEGLRLDPEMMAHIIQWVMREATYECLVVGGGKDVDRYIDGVTTFLEAALHGSQTPYRTAGEEKR
ncbi:putative HTH-type transcriptional regulator YvdT [bacterium HR24]|nr:putative HTH-type transcriptional regulator YvdT [bacterium HR24]